MASFKHLSVEILVKPFPSPHTAIQSKQDCGKHIRTPLDKFRVPSHGVPSHGALSCGVPSHMHGLLVLAVKHAAYKRVGELPADARSAEAGSELSILILHHGISGRAGQTYSWRIHVVDICGGPSADSR